MPGGGEANELYTLFVCPPPRPHEELVQRKVNKAILGLPYG